MIHIHHYVPKNPEITEHGFQTKLNKNIGISSSPGFININGLYHFQFFHGSIIWHSFMLCRICGVLDYCFLKNLVLAHTYKHTNWKGKYLHCEIKLVHIFNDDLLKKSIWQTTE